MENTVYKIPIKEKIFFTIEKILDLTLKIHPLQRYVNRRANNKYGMYLSQNNISEIDDVFADYRFNDIQKNDIVMDIGANVGAFSIFVSKMVKHVYAIEPMTTDILVKNIELNKIDNITVIINPLGNGIINLEWNCCAPRTLKGETLDSLIKMCDGHIDFLKIDCEGREWCIRSEDLKGIRRIEAEIHNFDGIHDLSDFLNILDDANFSYDYEQPRDGIIHVHAYSKTI